MNNFTKRAIGLAVLLCLFFAGFAQQNAIQKSLDTKASLFEQQPKLQPFAEQHLKQNLGIPEALETKKILSFDAKVLDSKIKENPEVLSITLPGFDGEWNLQLEPAQIFSDDFFVNSPKGTVTDEVDLGKYYRGVVAGKKNSLVSISVFDGEIQGMIAIEGHNYTLGKLLGQSENYILFDETEIDKEYPNFCSTQDNNTKPLEFDRPRAETKSTDKCVNVYFELDYDVFQNKGSVSGATNYMTAVFNEVATLYANENLTVKISEIFVWSSPSPYSGASSTTMLNDFRSTRPNFNGDLGHLIDFRPSNGGIAYVDVLCNNTYNYAYSGIDPTYKNVPTYSWTIEVITHEIGHNLGSPHTHDCSWPGGPIDNCQPPSGVCGPGPAPTNGGTIMSYCHLTSHGINFNNGFGPLPGDLIRNRVSNASCLSSCEDPNVCSVPSGISASDRTQTSIEVSWNSVSSANSYSLRYRQQGTSSWTTVNTSATTYNITGLSPLTTYDVQLQSNCDAGETSGYSNTQNFSTLSDQPTYCTSQGNDASYEWIAQVKVGSFTKNSGSAQYSDFTTDIINITQNQATSITLTPGFASSTYNEAWAIWADLNKDGDFTDAGEKLYQSPSLSSSAVNGSITIPSSSIIGQTRLRISMKYNANQTGPCESFSYGEVEDYTINIQEDIPEPCLTPTNLSVSSTSTTSISLSWSAAGSNESSYTLAYREQGTSSWTNLSVSGTNRTVSNLNHSTSYEFRIKANCGSESSGNSAIITGSTDTPAPCTAPSNLQTSNIQATSIDVSWSGSAAANNYNIEYRVSGSGSYTVSTTSNTSATLSGLSPNTSYDIRVRSNCDFESSAYTSTTASTPNAPINYCNSRGNNANSEWIQRVQIGNINNNSGSNGGYANYTSQVLQVTAGNSYSFTLTPGFSSGLFGTNTAPEYWKIWIDYNKDGDFTDAGELAYDAGGTSSSAVSGSISIPVSATALTTRMRVSMKYNGGQSSCETFSYGEVEDYNITISESVPQPCDAPSGLAASNVGETSATLSWSAVGPAQSYLLEYRVSGGSWSSLSTSNTSTTLTGLTASTTYDARVSADCGSESSPKSAIISFTTDDEAPTPVNYCASTGNNSSDEWIKKITIGSFSNNSGNNGGYGDFTSSTVTMAAGSNVSISLEPGFSSGLFGSNSYPEYWKIWIDYNGDGDFTDAGELAFDAGSTSTTIVNGSINVPSSASGSTRMRVSMKYNASQSSCENFAYGEVEDYTVSFGSATATSISSHDLEIEILLAPNPASNYVIANISGVSANKDIQFNLINLNGQLIKDLGTHTVNSSGSQLRFELGGVASGMYLMQYTDESGKRNVQRFVVR